MRNWNSCKPVVQFVLVLALGAVCLAQAPTPQPFSADFVITGKTADNVNGKFFFSPPKMRMDMNPHGQSVSMITDTTSQTSYMVMHAQHMFMEVHGNTNPMMRQTPNIPTKFDPNNPCASTAATCKKVGTETINGRACDKWQDTSASGTSTAWVDQKLHFPIKTLSADGSGMEFSNVKEGAPDVSQFEVPSGYRKMDMGMMGGQQPR
jgi:hypothetical protein